MKKCNFLVMLLVLAGLVTSCSQDDSIDSQNSENNRVTISANLGDEVETLLKSGPQTRATGDLQVSGYSLRYILEVWDESDAVAYREEKLITDASQAVTFDFHLSTAGDYTALLWADYVLSGATANGEGHYSDLYYTTNANIGLKRISIISSAYAVNTPSRDAFFGKSLFTKTDGVAGDAGTVIMRRPFGRINIIEKNEAMLPDLMFINNLSYDVPSSFNVLDGSVSDTYSVFLFSITSFPEGTTEKANLFYDYIFAPDNGQQLLSEIEMDYTLSGAFGNFTIPSNMPVERNKRTNISGNILIDPNITGLSVEVVDEWTDPDITQEMQ